MGSDVAIDSPPFLHRPKLQQTSVGEIFHGDLRLFYFVDCFVFLLHGVVGEWIHLFVCLKYLYATSPNLFKAGFQ